VDLGNLLLGGELIGITTRVDGAAVPDSHNLMPQLALDGDPCAGMRRVKIDEADSHDFFFFDSSVGPTEVLFRRQVRAVRPWPARDSPAGSLRVASPPPQRKRPPPRWYKPASTLCPGAPARRD